MKGPPVRAVIFDFYGTLGESQWQEWWMETIFTERGYRFDPEVDARWSSNAWDGKEHVEHSRSEDHYNAWLRDRWRSMLLECCVAEDDLEGMLAAIDAKRTEWRMQLYPETLDVLARLREDGLRLAICSNWDWDLDRHLSLTRVGDHVDVRVSSAWVGARKPHPRIFLATCDELGVDPAEAVFVGDNWVADVEGSLAAGLRAVHVWRYEDHPGDWLPVPPEVPEGVVRVPDLRPLPALVTSGG